MAGLPSIIFAALVPRAVSLLDDTAGAHPLLLAALTGFACAAFFSALPGPINLTILNEGAQRGFKWGFFIGLGAAMMDVVYCSISFTGISQIIDHGLAQTMMRLMGFVFLLILGFKFLSTNPLEHSSRINLAIEKLEVRIEQKVHPRSAFATGFVRVAGNLGVLGAWVAISATLMSTKAFFSAQEWVDDTIWAKGSCVAGVFTGTALWFLFWSFLVSRGQGRFSAKTLLRFQHGSGVCLIVTAMYEGVRIAWHLAQYRI
ncbi:MAG TPA: LysE family transporter [Candidatus Acidoferrales bacterium]|nr:LysE family transporter [Candidatus Acidoferrales bacterium]